MLHEALRATGCVLVLVAAWPHGLGAQAQPPAAASTPPFQDRLIEGLAALPTEEEGPSQVFDASGWPRFFRLETRLGSPPFEERRRSSVGYAVYGLLETPNHGVLSLDGSYAPRSGRASLTLRQRALPLGGGWQAQHDLGVIHTPAPDITRLPSRLFVPADILQGLSAEWENPHAGWQLLVSSGAPGRLQGLPSGGFQQLAGRRSTLGLQWQYSAPVAAGLSRQRPGWTLALQHETARGVSRLDAPRLPADFADGHATRLTVRHETADRQLQGQIVNSQASDVRGSRSGFWIDGEWQDGRRRHGLGLYYLEPELSWAQLPLANNLAGAYIRSGWQTRRWSVEGSLDWLRSISGRSASGTYAAAHARWRLSSRSSLGAGFSRRSFDSEAWSSHGDWRWENAWGSSGLRLELTGAERQAASRRLSYDQDWRLPQGWSLATSLGLGQLQAQAEHQEAEEFWSAALSLTAPLSPRADLRGSLNSENSSSGQRRHSLNLGANWRLSSRWSLAGSLHHSVGRQRALAPLIDPLAPPLPELAIPSERSFHVVLRYEMQAGSRRVPLGGRPQEGGGRIEGTLYFDANRSGTQEAAESGVPGVMVFLDNRFAVRTDAQGRFEFPFVAAGARIVSVRNDTLPLPWGVVHEGLVQVDVRLRENTRLSIPVQRSD